MSKVFLLSQSGQLEETEFSEAFPFIREKSHIVSLVGAGGKTSLMFQLADICSRMGRHVLVSTTTHIMRPQDGSFAGNEEEIKERWKCGRIAVVGEETSDGKLAMLPKERLERFMKNADIVFLEADGSKRMPLKVPIEKEPVLLPQSDIVIAVAGLSALGHSLEDNCFRLTKAAALLHKSEKELVGEKDIARILTSEKGTRKDVGDREYYIVLNQCDNEDIKRKAQHIAVEMRKRGAEHIAAACLMEV